MFYLHFHVFPKSSPPDPEDFDLGLAHGMLGKQLDFTFRLCGFDLGLAPGMPVQRLDFTSGF